VVNNFYPSKSFIQDITNDFNAVITFTADHEFTPGELVSFRVEKPFGMHEINKIQTKVISITDDTITTHLDTTTWTPFTLANLNTAGTSPPCCVPSASSFIPFEEVSRVTLIDTFDNKPNSIFN